MSVTKAWCASDLVHLKPDSLCQPCNHLNPQPTPHPARHQPPRRSSHTPRPQPHATRASCAGPPGPCHAPHPASSALALGSSTSARAPRPHFLPHPPLLLHALRLRRPPGLNGPCRLQPVTRRTASDRPSVRSSQPQRPSLGQRGRGAAPPHAGARSRQAGGGDGLTLAGALRLHAGAAGGLVGEVGGCTRERRCEEGEPKREGRRVGVAKLVTCVWARETGCAACLGQARRRWRQVGGWVVGW